MKKLEESSRHYMETEKKKRERAHSCKFYYYTCMFSVIYMLLEKVNGSKIFAGVIINQLYHFIKSVITCCVRLPNLFSNVAHNSLAPQSNTLLHVIMGGMTTAFHH